MLCAEGPIHLTLLHLCHFLASECAWERAIAEARNFAIHSLMERPAGAWGKGPPVVTYVKPAPSMKPPAAAAAARAVQVSPSPPPAAAASTHAAPTPAPAAVLPRVSVIGTSGRGLSRDGLDAAMFEKMVAAADAWITANVSGDNLHLVSGGAAWADHVAVALFLRKRSPHLTLFLPCALDEQGPGSFRYRDTGARDWKINPGRTVNRYHDEFSAALGRDTLTEIGEAARMGAVLRVMNGFLPSNSEHAKSEYVLALTWAPGAEPEWGGTLDTWKKSHGIKHHISLTTLRPAK